MAAPGPGRDFPGFPKFCGGVVLTFAASVAVGFTATRYAVHRLKPVVVRRSLRRT